MRRRMREAWRVCEWRAGWHDARRTCRPRVWQGRRYGDAFYAAGYAARVIRDRGSVAA